MIGFHASLWWRDEEGQEHHLASWQSPHSLGGRSEGRWDLGDEGLPCWREPHWYGLVPESGIVEHTGDGYPSRYLLRTAALVHLLSTDRVHQLRELTLAARPLDAGAITAALRGLPSGTLVHAEEWDQS